MGRLDQYIEQLRTFSTERDWDQFHTPENTPMVTRPMKKGTGLAGFAIMKVYDEVFFSCRSK